jgi:bla regulator protein blaR1
MITNFSMPSLFTSEILHVLTCATLASSAGILLVLILRKPLSRKLSAVGAYALWSLIPLAAAVALLPPPVLTIPMHALQPMSSETAPMAGVAPTTLPAPTRFDLEPWLIAVWTLGALMVLSEFIRQQNRFVRSLGRLTIVDREIVRAQTTVGCPALVGAWRPWIVLPTDFEQRYNSRERELILAHERCHRARGDAQINLLAAALRCVFWFNPLVHFAARRFRFDQELACDATVISRFPQARRSYADAMLKTQLADFGLPVGCHWQAFPSARSNHPLQERITMLTKPLPGRLRLALGTATTLAIVMAGSYAAWAAQPARHVNAPIDASVSPLISASNEPAADTKIRVRRQHAPSYPQQLIDSGIEGVIGVRAQIDTLGNVVYTEIEFSDPPAVRVLEGTALSSIKSWTFHPPTIGGQPMATSIVVPIRYRIIDGHNDTTPMPKLPADAWDGVVVVFDRPTDFADTSSVSRPRVTHLDFPNFPEGAIPVGEVIKVFVKVRVDEYGHPRSAVVDSMEPSDLHPTIAAPLIAVAMQGKYTAGTKNGRPVAGDLLLKSIFRGSDDLSVASDE